ncbi:ATP/GTP binding protein (nucleomorph) [Lotharella oceanica]|uniref:GPN-loop GTPase n=1 Tax=Lotharella oceanica TaxID=641309 RepID=A0A060D774_9EUKA|nr:ATP/GTP binding protein [Lotharella oceanica]|mmetsp:Transcript_2817/g.5349  ORF Transcript_2817/g.5349 Transcript_2817/m.5349 type:complete len:283 (+) Transcript_2817:39-887(+)
MEWFIYMDDMVTSMFFKVYLIMTMICFIMSFLSDKPPVISSALLFIGPGGSGKTSIIHSIHRIFIKKNLSHFLVNLDPSNKFLPFVANLDIRDTINFEYIKNKFKLGPNAAILTALNLYITKINQLIEICNHINKTLKYFLCDTPGQLEIFLWSISGYIIINIFKIFFKICIIYVIDIKKCNSLRLLMVNLLIAATVAYRIKNRFLIIWNKNDYNEKDFYNYYSNSTKTMSYFNENRKDYLLEVYNIFMEIYYKNSLKIFICLYTSTMSGVGFGEFISFVEC